MKILIKNGIVVNVDKMVEADVLIVDGRIERVAKTIDDVVDQQINARGLHVLPGLIDLHVHFRTPGKEEAEDLISGSRAASKGGFTSVFCMPNTDPAIDNEGLAQWVYDEGRKLGLVDIYPVGAITKARQGKELTEFGSLQRAGCRTLSDDGCSVEDSLVLRRALEYARQYNLLLVSHCEDSRLTKKGAMRESFIASRYGINAIAEIAESIIVSRDIELARYLKTKIHLAHISTARSIELIRRAKQDGVNVSCETCPHYFTLTVEDIEQSQFNSNFKVNPPLGLVADVEAVKKGLADGTIDCIVTDHAPHLKAEKELPFENAPFGLVGLEWAFAVSYTNLVVPKIIDLPGLVNKMSTAPALLTGLEGQGKISSGYKADITIVDLNQSWTICSEEIVSKSKNTPYLGRTVQGLIKTTIHNGTVTYDNKSE